MRTIGKSRWKLHGWRELAKAMVLTSLVPSAGCGMQPYEAPNNREYPPGPGILSGKDGEFVIYRKKELAAEPPAESAKAAEDEKDED